MFAFLVAASVLFTHCRVANGEETEITFTASVTENKQQGYFIGNIATGSDVFMNATDAEKQNARFSYLKDSGFNRYFSLDEATGNLNTSATNIDRELLCEFITNCILKLEIAVTSGNGKFFAIVIANIEVLDVNDNSPTFLNSITHLDINENEPVNTEYRIGSVFDADLLDTYSIQSFSLEQSVEVFSLDTKAENDQGYSLSLILVQNLDREIHSSVSVTIKAIDGGNPARSATLVVTVTIGDENDNYPEFSKSSYNVTINENIPQNSVIATLTATDKDINENGRISFRIRDRQSNVDTIKRLFRLDDTSGELSVISELTKEPAEYYEFIVEAIDNGKVPLMNQTTVMITVNDVENYPPTIEVNLLSPGHIGFVDIEENQPTEVFVAHVNVEDYDKGENGQFSCHVPNELFALEKFLGRGFKIVVDGLLDREDISMHNVTVVCQDHGTPSKTSTETFLVRVLDVNDNDPVFEQDVYSVSIDENNKQDAKITQVKATDLDLGLNGTVEYILADNQEKFHINNNTGVIFANQAFDREQEGIIVFRVLGVDHGPSRRTGTTTVSLTLNDTNDNAPVMIPARPELRIAENLPINTSLGLLFAKDKDIGINAMFSFSFAQVQTTFPFKLYENGDIRTTEVLDREDKDRYEIPVTVTDMGKPPLNNTQYITIYVTDENDNAPKVTFPTEDNDPVSFVYLLDGYNVVTTIAAYDQDAGENGSLTYNIIGGNEFEIFEIDPELGEISVKKIVDIREDLTIALLIEVSDKARSSKSTRVTLKVHLVYANATNMAAVGENVGNKYIIISVVVIVTTVAVAVAIVGVILFLRSSDNKKHREEDSNGYADSGISSNIDSIPPEVDNNTNSNNEKLKKKKEVSFSLEYSLDGLDGGRNSETSTDEYTQSRFYDQPPMTGHHGPPMYTDQHQEKIDRHMKALKLQQYLWETKSRSWENSMTHQLPVGDSESETSRETITCDSGRGGSEDDVSMSSPGADDKRFFSTPQDPKGKHVQFLHSSKYGSNPGLPTVKESTPIHNMPPPRPAPYKLSARDLQNNAKHIDNCKLAIKTFQNPVYSMNNLHNAHNVHNSWPMNTTDSLTDYYKKNSSAYPRMRNDSGSSFRSNDEDTCSTTTSGSYTLDNDINMIDMYPNQRDLVV
ncbi:hypothetical protein ACF0H5_011284 [Mactra antiquata]